MDGIKMDLTALLRNDSNVNLFSPDFKLFETRIKRNALEASWHCTVVNEHWDAGGPDRQNGQQLPFLGLPSASAGRLQSGLPNTPLGLSSACAGMLQSGKENEYIHSGAGQVS